MTSADADANRKTPRRCHVCQSRAARPQRTTCADCARRHVRDDAARRKWRVAQGLCQYCGKGALVEPYTYCPACRDRRRGYRPHITEGL